MSAESVRTHLLEAAPDLAILEFAVSTATVADAAAALGVVPGQIAKTLSLRVGEAVFLLVAAGDARLDNKKVRAALGGKPRLLEAEEVVRITGHPVGGVCPFGLATPVPVLCDVSLRAYREVIPAAGSPNSAVRVPTERLAELVDARWVDVCADPRLDTAAPGDPGRADPS